MSKPDSGLQKVAQIAIVCRDIEASAARWAAVLGKPVPKAFTTDPGHKVNMRMRGVSSDAQAKLAFFNLGAVDLELIQPLGGDSSWQEALDQNGESVHHLGFWVEDLEGSLEHLTEMDMPVLHQGYFDEKRSGSYAYVDSQKALGVTIELLHRGPSS